MTVNGEAEKESDVTAATHVKRRILWYNVVVLTLIHLSALYAFLFVIPRAKLLTSMWHAAYAYFGMFGITAGVHRYWTHRSYKTKLPLGILLATMYLTTGMNSIFDWVRDHRVHHKFSETDADPHNAKRGLFFSHVGWLMQKKHPEVLRRGRQIDMSDVLADPVVQFEEKYYAPLLLTLTFLLPISVPCLLWDETWWNSTFWNIFRWSVSLNFTWSVNSFAHTYGNHPYNRNIQPAENKVVSALAGGEGWHNYHHTFPWDYKTAELGDYRLNFTTAFIDFFAYIGWAYDLKQPSEQLVERVVKHIGDGSHVKWGHVTEVPEETEELLNASNSVEEILLNVEEKVKVL